MMQPSPYPIRHRIAMLIRRFPLLIQGPYYVYRFFQPKYTLGAVGVVLDTSGRVLLVEHVYHPRLPWGLPGGWVGFNEDPGAAVIRELHEELGLIVESCLPLHIQRTQYHHVDMAFLCQVSTPITTLSAELLACRYYSVADLPRLHRFHYQAIMMAVARHAESL